MYDLLRRHFGLNSSEVEILKCLRRERRAEEISRMTGLTIPSVNRYLNNLLKIGLIERRAVCCTPKKGRFYLYFYSEERARMLLKSAIRDKIRQLKEELEGL